MRLKNEIFAQVLDWLIQKKKVHDQKDLAIKTGISQNTVSRIMTGKVEPSDDTLRKLNATFGNIFNMQYLRGESTIMLIADVAYYQQHPNEHPFADFDKVIKQKAASPAPAEPSANIPDMSSVFNAALAAKDDAIESLKRELLTKDDLIQSLRDQLAAKDQLIAEQKSRLIDYRRIIDSNQLLSDYPFPVGVAERHDNQESTCV